MYEYPSRELETEMFVSGYTWKEYSCFSRRACHSALWESSVAEEILRVLVDGLWRTTTNKSSPFDTLRLPRPSCACEMRVVLSRRQRDTVSNIRRCWYSVNAETEFPLQKSYSKCACANSALVYLGICVVVTGLAIGNTSSVTYFHDLSARSPLQSTTIIKKTSISASRNSAIDAKLKKKSLVQLQLIFPTTFSSVVLELWVTL
jgi:hypothetical protein